MLGFRKLSYQAQIIESLTNPQVVLNKGGFMSIQRMPGSPLA